jgi:hypothetical protein
MMISYSNHFMRRQEQRGLRRDVLNFILEFGEFRFSRKASWLLVERRSLPAHLRNTSLALRASQWLVLVSDGVLVTCYRCDSPIRSLRSSH